MLILLLGTKVPSSWEQRFQRTKVLGKESSKGRKFSKTKVSRMKLLFSKTKVFSGTNYESSMNRPWLRLSFYPRESSTDGLKIIINIRKIIFYSGDNWASCLPIIGI